MDGRFQERVGYNDYKIHYVSSEEFPGCFEGFAALSLASGMLTTLV